MCVFEQLVQSGKSIGGPFSAFKLNKYIHKYKSSNVGGLEKENLHGEEEVSLKKMNKLIKILKAFVET